MDIHNKPQHIIKIGSLEMGSGKAIILQSMTSTPTKDIQATVEQVIRIADAGAHLVRITARDTREAEALALIKKELLDRGYLIPLSADIHFNPKAADVAARIVEKVRINPGNYMDKKSGKTAWSSKEYQAELDKIKEKLSGLVKICKEHATAIRVGVNHGSLSERIINKYGDTAEGMAESAMEFIRIFQELHFDQLVISLKASNVMVMVAANQLFIKKMEAENIYYPLHLGVTEAGDAEEGRIKSAVGIGTLLGQGIGDTIRVSLTEESEFEIPVAQKIAKISKENQWSQIMDHQSYLRRPSHKIQQIGKEQVPVVITNAGLKAQGKLKADYQFKDQKLISLNGDAPLQSLSTPQILQGDFSEEASYYVRLQLHDWTPQLASILSSQENIVLVLEHKEGNDMMQIHQLLQKIEDAHITTPLILKLQSEEKDLEKLMIQSSVLSGPFFLNGQMDGIWIDSPHFDSTEISFGILQATRQRVSKTEYIACPSCGRTLFNIQEKLQDIKKKTAAFKGLKIAVMGCIVNGLGEMADADYGYIGAGPGKVNIYKKHDLLLKNVPEDEAADALLEIIETNNRTKS